MTKQQREKITSFLNELHDNTPLPDALEFIDQYSIDFKTPINVFIEKYERYSKWWDITYRGKDKQYMKKEDVKIDFLTYVYQRKFLYDDKLKKTPLEEYLFGEHDPEELERAMKKMLKQLNLPVYETK